MKYLGITTMLFAMIWSWKAPQLNDSPSLAQHTEIQNRIADLITHAVEQYRPKVEQIQFNKIWTKPVNSDHIDIQFEYSLIIAGKVYENIRGEAQANKKTNDKTNDTWTIHSVRVNQMNIEISEGFSVVTQ